MGHWTDYEGYVVALAVPVLWAAMLGGVGGDAAYWLHAWWLFPVVLLLTILADTVAISRGALLLPALLLLAPLSGESLSVEQAVRVVIITSAFGYAASALAFARFGTVDGRLVVSAVAVALPAAVTAGLLAPMVAPTVVLAMAAATLVVTAYSMLTAARRRAKRLVLTHDAIDLSHPTHTHNTLVRSRDEHAYRYCRCGWRVRLPGLVFAGLADGLAGLGMPGLAVGRFMQSEIPLPVAVGTLHAAAATTAALAAAAHLNGPSVALPWNVLAITATAVLLGGQMAPYLAGRIESEYPERVAAVMLVVAAVALVIRLR